MKTTRNAKNPAAKTLTYVVVDATGQTAHTGRYVEGWGAYAALDDARAKGMPGLDRGFTVRALRTPKQLASFGL